MSTHSTPIPLSPELLLRTFAFIPIPCLPPVALASKHIRSLVYVELYNSVPSSSLPSLGTTYRRNILHSECHPAAFVRFLTISDYNATPKDVHVTRKFLLKHLLGALEKIAVHLPRKSLVELRICSVYVTLEEIFPGRIPIAVQNIDKLAVQCSMYSNVFKFSAVLTKLMTSKLIALDIDFNRLVIYPVDEYAMSESSDIMDFVMLPNLSTFRGSPSNAYVICNSHFRMTDNLYLEIEDDDDPYVEKLLEVLNHLQAVRKLILNIKLECATHIIYKFLNVCPFLTFIGCKVVPLSNITEVLLIQNCQIVFEICFIYKV
ncbi:hypothetical protein C8J55DRAFT_487272 [Lentinula edodes]|uniref:F-box domain-containing protein n=1 Tax=Lentinula lateritia TaxID=40482 RepID=A0A9W9ARS0_9AGAR|nr:hypothetical protein C8J55DRAFT_487272 [Lentinula edodes]